MWSRSWRAALLGLCLVGCGDETEGPGSSWDDASLPDGGVQDAAAPDAALDAATQAGDDAEAGAPDERVDGGLTDDASSEGGTSMPVTYRRDIAPILEERCSACHFEGSSLVPYPITTYEDAYQNAVQIAAVVWSGEMPPCDLTDTQCRLTSRERNLIQAWVMQGRLEASAP